MFYININGEKKEGRKKKKKNETPLQSVSEKPRIDLSAVNLWIVFSLIIQDQVNSEDINHSQRKTGLFLRWKAIELGTKNNLISRENSW